VAVAAGGQTQAAVAPVVAVAVLTHRLRLRLFQGQRTVLLSVQAAPAGLRGITTAVRAVTVILPMGHPCLRKAGPGVLVRPAVRAAQEERLLQVSGRLNITEGMERQVRIQQVVVAVAAQETQMPAEMQAE